MSRLKEIRERFDKDNITAIRQNLPYDESRPDPDYYFVATCELLKMVDELQAQERKDIRKISKLEARLKIDEPHPFEDGYDIVDLLNDRNKKLQTQLDAVHGLVTEQREATKEIDFSPPAVVLINGFCSNLEQALQESE